jgi:FkbM family methyltransferase
MLRQQIKDLLTKIPPVKRVFDQRDQALRTVIDTSAKLAALTHEIESLTACKAAAEQNAIPEFSRVLYAHWGEDAIAAHALQGISKGRYLDIGCYHPALYSNTMALYAKGWSGVNVDPNPFMIKQYEHFRPRDTSLNCAVGEQPGEMDYFMFHEWASSNTGSETFANIVSRNSGIDLPKSIKVKVIPLLEIMDRHFNDGVPDFMNIDVEDMDVAVLQSNNWERFRPKIIAVEDINFDFSKPAMSPTYEFMVDIGYRMFSRCIFTSFFSDERSS